MDTGAPPALQKLVEQADGPVLVVHDLACGALAHALEGEVTLLPAGTRQHDARRWAAVLLLATDAGSLRRLAAGLPRLGRTRGTACFLAEAASPPLLVARLEWPAMTSLNARRLPSDSVLTVVRWSGPVLANAVFEEMGRHLGSDRGTDGMGVVVATAEQAGDPDLVVPPDVVLSPTEVAVPDYPVTGRPPVVVTDPDLLAGPHDEGVLNPVGFVQRPPQGPVALDAHRGATAAYAAELRDHERVDIDWGAAPADVARTVAGLAMAGVPLTTATVPPEAAGVLGPGLADLLATGVETRDHLRREEHSVLLRRTALLTHSTLAWRSRLAAAAGLRSDLFPSLSVVLATRRPEQLEFALAQVAAQRGVAAELVLATHGFEADLGSVRDALGGVPFTLVPMGADAIFGDVLNAGVAAAGGELVVKMDDDDWYGPDFLLDLLLARHYSGAEVVGTTAEFVYLTASDRTVRRNKPTEVAARSVAGGTMLLGRDHLRSLGGFRRVRRFVDASLLSAVHTTGGTVYRAHGLGYVLRRTPSGHTWDAPDDFFLDPATLDQQWPGFAPSRLLGASPAD